MSLTLRRPRKGLACSFFAKFRSDTAKDELSAALMMLAILTELVMKIISAAVGSG